VWKPVVLGWQKDETDPLDTVAPARSSWRLYKQREFYIAAADQTSFNRKVFTLTDSGTGAPLAVTACQEACLVDRLGCGAFTWDPATGECVITPIPYYHKGTAEKGLVAHIPTPKGAVPSVIVHHTREYWQLVQFEQRRLPWNKDSGSWLKVRAASGNAANELRCTHLTEDEGDTGQAARCRAHTRMTDCVHNTWGAPGEVERPCVFIPKQLPDSSWWEVITETKLSEPSSFTGYSETVTLPVVAGQTAADYIETCARLCSSYDTPCESFSYKESDRTCAFSAAQEATTGASLTAAPGWVYYESMDDMTATLASSSGVEAKYGAELAFTWGFSLEATGNGVCTHTAAYRKDAAVASSCLGHNTAFGTHKNEHVNA
jgi:hypothetical protein